ncbi:NADH dehydrogenase subunit 6 (mitochondrion) [Megalops cyprinoides]|uniref:NADH-ubiquinone oxidoreductase chain 6 n=1 Tax=Megalops cyprinoides TaxID=118141 RepID=Q76MB4_9TELE|nr:NADH dehydrogenase subunit 6 [Megalops cyprinoides]BAD12297.1 NADH dehydrogenase subunit 6 [Megalops cyprinoides]
MAYFTFLFLVGLVLGFVAVASNPAPYFAALGLVVVAAIGCGMLASHGGSFLSLILFLIYLGGMLVVFVYSAALAAEPYPESWGDWSVLGYVVVYLFSVGLVGGWLSFGWYGYSWVVADELEGFSVLRGDYSGVSLMYSLGGGMLVVCGWVLLLALFVVLELTRGLSRGALRAV